MVGGARFELATNGLKVLGAIYPATSRLRRSHEVSTGVRALKCKLLHGDSRKIPRFQCAITLELHQPIRHIRSFSQRIASQPAASRGSALFIYFVPYCALVIHVFLFCSPSMLRPRRQYLPHHPNEWQVWNRLPLSLRFAL